MDIGSLAVVPSRYGKGPPSSPQNKPTFGPPPSRVSEVPPMGPWHTSDGKGSNWGRDRHLIDKSGLLIYHISAYPILIRMETCKTMNSHSRTLSLSLSLLVFLPRDVMISSFFSEDSRLLDFVGI